MEKPIFQVDAFTSEPFKGNPAGVCMLESEAPEPWMQGVASDMNLSETAFLLRQRDAFSIRYFTPAVEVALCGHATLASAHVLWGEGLVDRGEPIRLTAKGGRLKAVLEGDWICLDFPAIPVHTAPVPAGLPEALGAEPRSVSRLPEHGYLVELESEEAVQDLRPDFRRLRQGGYWEIITTAACKQGPYTFVSRFFAPEIGIDEDPVTGVAHCSLGPYWAGKTGQTEMIGHQISRRGGVVRVRVRGDRVELLGQAVTVIRGKLVV